MQRIASIFRNLISRREVPFNPLDSFPEFENFCYEITAKPTNPKATAWDKLMECERRLEMYRWVEKLNDPAKAQHRLLLNDTISAFLLSYEATLQFLKEQLENAGTNISFNNWLNNQPQYDVFMRGLRTLRQFAAHIEVKPTPSKIVVVIGGSKRDGTSATGFARTWKLPELSQADLNRLRPQSKSNAPDLNDWNALVEQSNVETIFKQGLFRLKEVLDKAESIL